MKYNFIIYLFDIINTLWIYVFFIIYCFDVVLIFFSINMIKFSII